MMGHEILLSSSISKRHQVFWPSPSSLRQILKISALLMEQHAIFIWKILYINTAKNDKLRGFPKIGGFTVFIEFLWAI